MSDDDKTSPAAFVPLEDQVDTRSPEYAPPADVVYDATFHLQQMQDGSVSLKVIRYDFAEQVWVEREVLGMEHTSAHFASMSRYLLSAAMPISWSVN